MADFNLFDLMGLENPVKVEEEKKAEAKAKKEAEAKAKKETAVAEKKAKAKTAVKPIKLPIRAILPYCEPFEFTIEGKEEATSGEITEELKKAYPHLICVNPLTSEAEGYSLSYSSYGAVAKGTMKVSKMYFGLNEIPFDRESEDADVDVSVLTEAFFNANPQYRGLKVEFLQKEGACVPVFSGTKLEKELKQEKLLVIVPGVKELTVDATEGVITPDAVKDSVKEDFPFLVPILYKEDKAKEWKCILLPKASEKSSKAPKETFDISSGDVQVSLLFTRLLLKAEDFKGETDVTSAQICDWLVKSGYPEFAASRCTIEKASDKLLVATVKSSRKG